MAAARRRRRWVLHFRDHRSQKSFLLSHRTVPNGAGDHRAARNSPLARGGSLNPPYVPPPHA